MEQDNNNGSNIASAQDRGFSSTSYIIGGLIIGAMLIVGGLYLMGYRDLSDMRNNMMAETVAPVPGTPEEVAASAAATEAATTALSTQGTSDELGSIDADLKATNLDSLGDPSQL